MRITTILAHLFRTGALAAMAASLYAGQVNPIRTDRKGIAIDGYDPVAYFTDNKPVRGSTAFSYKWMDATYLFSSADHRDHFAAEPQKYVPQYGGYCAYAVSQGHTASIDPEAWRIVDGKLYLNYSKGVQKKWAADTADYIQQADRNWPTLHR